VKFLLSTGGSLSLTQSFGMNPVNLGLRWLTSPRN